MISIFYITELSIPSKRAQAIHIFKMLDNFGFFSKKIYLLTPYCCKNISDKKIIKEYNLLNLNSIKLISIFKKNYYINFFLRIFYSFICSYLLNKKKNSLIVTRSILSSFFLSIFRIKHFVEIHQELKGFTKFIFVNCNYINSKMIIKVIFISKALRRFYNFKKSKNIVLHDGVELRNFNKKPLIKKKIRNIFYSGSFYKGRGIEEILKIAEKCKEYNFYLYGKKREIIKTKLKNVKIFPFVKHYKIPKLISKNADLLLMPYQKKVFISSYNCKNDNSSFMSPLKMFEYLASGVPILSSNIKVLREILVNKKNAIMINKYWDIKEWVNTIKHLDKNYKLRSFISKSALETAQKHSWHTRAMTIFNLFLKNKN